MTIQSDYHMHTSFSSDSDSPMDTMIAQAVKIGLSRICFTEHMDRDFIRPTKQAPDFEVNTDAYLQALQELKNEYAGKIDILFGIELGLQPHIADYYRQYIRKYPFDFIIGSSHICHRRDPYMSTFYNDRPEEAAYLEYFESILENIKVYDDFDVYGHLDYAVRYGPNKNLFYSYEAYADILDEILRALISSGKGIEVNTSGFKYGLEHPHPTEAVIKRYCELGGEIITIGSDAHIPAHIAYDFSKIPALLMDCGFQYYTVFKNRKAEFVKL